MPQKHGRKKRSRRSSVNKRLSAVIGMLSCTIAALAGFRTYLIHSIALRYHQALDLGDKYLTEMNYDDAIFYYQKAINIEPSEAEGYLSLADLYSGQKDYDSAMEVLTYGQSHVKSSGLSEISEKMNAVSKLRTTYINEWEAQASKPAAGHTRSALSSADSEKSAAPEYGPSGSSAGDAYEKLAEQYISRYGEPGYRKNDDGTASLTGLCYVNVLDMNGDGIKEMITAWAENDAPLVTDYTYEIWSYDGLEQKSFLLYRDPGDGLLITDGKALSVRLRQPQKNENMTYLMTGTENNGGDYNYIGFTGKNTIGIAFSVQWNAGSSPEYVINGAGYDKAYYDNWMTDEEDPFILAGLGTDGSDPDNEDDPEYQAESEVSETVDRLDDLGIEISSS
ncbi:MAG: tetratricopeptide repeat protein [Lachnospiraceae bacterium]|jgi:tetratricopeptide (TPR) repeat protein|nr:tetratricopeptide repeat protein [Lachnospiraceae bacterium]MCH4063530.1 tetratricopeptide repeat protein [Lachnospiraceae bacterium]MCH4104678.1 tetratricopeptide repeat protein [Lachnospiraceae bacterium]MCI1310043.1 tetratricopeptide repeat protein [Lachnospiraceae bacterium]MCI1358649.1 tetratricopeptide repeat protein [Lachnospiraceae bacterium]